MARPLTPHVRRRLLAELCWLRAWAVEDHVAPEVLRHIDNGLAALGELQHIRELHHRVLEGFADEEVRYEERGGC